MQQGTSGTFTYANPRTVHWGAGCLPQHLEQELGQRNASRVLVITTHSVAHNDALGGRLTELLGPRHVGPLVEIGQHAPAAVVAEAVAIAREVQPDVLISFGGGSPIDAAKAVAFALTTKLDLRNPAAAEQARRFQPKPDELLPQIALPTTLSAAELSGLAGFTTEAEHEKVGLRGEALIPRAIIFDAELSLETPLPLWLSTGIRAVDHAVETLLAPGSHPFSDTLALEALRRLQTSLLQTCAAPSDLAARTESQLGAWFSFTLPGPAAAGLSHTLGKRIGSRHGIPHGVSSCLLLPHVMRYLAPRFAAVQARIAEALGVQNAADGVADLIARLGLPHHLQDYGLSETDLVTAAAPVASTTYPLDDLVSIYRAAL
ncbi:MAG TPA: iron-containing alcohol dehydrogenase [Chloroflexota bacterium]|nr:iron-containing alcohol dehydrogenase [Chloroflexota bacterium]